MMSLDDIWDRIDNANLISDIEGRKAAIEGAIRNLQHLLDTGDVRVWYPLGYAYYCHPNRQIRGGIEASEMVRSLSNAIQNGVERSLSHLYLAFHYFDIKDFERAKFHADSVCEEELDETIAVELQELKLCIMILTNGVEKSISSIHRYSGYIESLTSPAMPPLVLMNTLENELTGKAMNSAIRKALHSLDRAYPVLGKDGFSRLAAR